MSAEASSSVSEETASSAGCETCSSALCVSASVASCVRFVSSTAVSASVAAIFIAFSFVFQEISRCKNVTFYAKGVPAVSNFCRRSMILQNCVKNIAQTMFRRCRLQTAKRFCRFAGFCGTVCKTMSFSLTASEFVCSTLPLLFEFCIAQFFCTVCVIFVP